MINNEEIQALKAAAENIDRGEMLALWLRMVKASARGHKKVDMALLDEAITAMNALLAANKADKALIAEQAKRDDMREVRTLTVKLPESVIDAICLTAAEIHNLGRGVSDDRAQEIIDSIRCAAGIKLQIEE